MTSFTGTVDLTTTAGTITPMTSAAFSGGVLSPSVMVSQSGPGKTITATRTGGIETGTSNTFTVNYGALDHFEISPISSPQMVRTTITGITLTAQDLFNNTVTSYNSPVTYGGTAGVTGTSSAFTAGRLMDVSVTPTEWGSGLTFIVTASGKAGARSFDVNPFYTYLPLVIH
jgi:hypothetical protein